MLGAARSGLGKAVSGDMNHGNSSGLSMGASSQVTDANSPFSGGHQLPSSSSINDESCLHLPASPMSSSNKISGSPIIDGSSLFQLSPQNEQIQKQSALSPTYQSMVQEAGMLPAQKKPRLGDVPQPQTMQQLLQRHQNIQLHASVQPQRFTQLQQQQQQMIQALPQLQRIQMQQRPQMPMGSPLHLIPPVRLPLDGGLCTRRLMQYMYHQNYRPADNSINYWKRFVAEYFAPRAKKRWCFSSYHNSGNPAFGAFPQAAMDSWQCGICCCKSGKGFEATYDVLPRLDQIKFDHGVLDELLYVDMPNEIKLRSGMMVLECAKAVQESVHEQCRVVREGQLRIIFTPDLKILCWEFCSRGHEELLPRRVIANQVHQLLNTSQKFQDAVNEKASTISAQDLQAYANMFLSASQQLKRNVELPLLNDLGFPKRYVRCLQISEVVNCMKELIDFSQAHKMGPIDSLKNYTQQAVAKLQAQKMKVEQTDPSQNLLADQNMLNKFMAMHPGLTRLPGNNLSPAVSFPNNSPSPAAPLGSTANNYQHLLRNSDHSFSGLNHNQTQPFQMNGPVMSVGRSLQYPSAKNHQQQQQDLHGKPPPPCNMEAPSQATQNLQHQPPEMTNNGSLTPPVKGLVKSDVPAPVQNESVGDMKKATAPPCNNDASKPASMNNSFSASSNGCDIKQEALDNFDIVDFDAVSMGDLLDSMDW